MKRYSEFMFGDMLLIYFLDEKECMSMTLVPAGMKEQVLCKEYRAEPLVQLHAVGDPLPNGYGNAVSLADGVLTVELKAEFEAVAVHLK